MPLPELFSVLGYAFTPLSLAVLATAAVVVALGLYPLLGDEPFEESLFFLLFCLAVSLWLTGFGWAYGAPDAGRALQWLRVAYLGVPVIPAALYTVCVASVGIAERRRWRLAVAWSMSAFFVVQAVGVGSVFRGVIRYDWGWFPDFTATGSGLIAYTACAVGAALWEYWERYRSAPGEQERARAGRFLVAFGVGSLATVDYLPAYGIEAYPAGFLGVLAMSVVVGRTIRSYQLTEFSPAFAADRILRTMSDPVLVCHREGRIRAANRAATAVVARDIRERKELEEQLRHHALHDRLTGLPNRALYEDRLEQMQRWRENGTDLSDDARVMVNASPGEVESGAYVDRVRDALERSGLPARALEVELTERTVAEDERGQKFIRSILDLAGELELDVVAEGVEEASDLEALRDLGVLRAQGFLWSEPVPPEAVESRW